MKSKIKFDLTEQNDPCIIAEISHDTEDLRDKVAKKFVEEIGYDSNMLNVVFMPSDNSITRLFIRPVSNLNVLDYVNENNTSYKSKYDLTAFEEIEELINKYYNKFEKDNNRPLSDEEKNYRKGNIEVCQDIREILDLNKYY